MQPKQYIVRSKDAGVFAGEITSEKATSVEMRNARRLWYWDGASSLSELAQRGVSRPENCKFPPSVPKIWVFGVCEIIEMSSAAIASIAEVSEWTQQ